MAKKTKTLDLVAKLGSKGKRAFNAHKGDETEFSTGGNLPEGIEGGIAQLVDCKFDSYAKGDMKGEPYFYAAGIVVEPEEHEGRNIKGLRTSIIEPVCDTPRRIRQDVDDHLDWILNQIRVLGVETDGVDYEDIQEVVAVLEKEAPYFRFRTWKGEATEDYPNPRVQHQWEGVVEGYEPEEGEVVEDNSDAKPKKRGPKKLRVAEDTEPSSEEEEEELSLAELGDLADADDEDAQTKLTALADAQSFNVESVESWGDVATALKEGGGEAEDGEDGEDGEAPPEKDDVFFYKPPRKRKSVECIVTAVFPTKKTCTLKNLDDKKIFKAVPWDKLSEEA